MKKIIPLLLVVLLLTACGTAPQGNPDLQITRGGNIIMVQVENEYGSYGEDKEYVSAVRDMVREAGFTDVRLWGDMVRRKPRENEQRIYVSAIRK